MAIPRRVEDAMFHIFQTLANGGSKHAVDVYEECAAFLKAGGHTTQEFDTALHKYLAERLENPAVMDAEKWAASKTKALAGLENHGDVGGVLSKMIKEKPAVSGAVAAGSRKTAISPEAVRASQQRGPRTHG